MDRQLNKQAKEVILLENHLDIIHPGLCPATGQPKLMQSCLRHRKEIKSGGGGVLKGEAAQQLIVISLAQHGTFFFEN